MPRHKKLFLIEWDADHGPEWMHIDNLKTLLFTGESTREKLLDVTDITEEMATLIKQSNDMADAVINFAGAMHPETHANLVDENFGQPGD